MRKLGRKRKQKGERLEAEERPETALRLALTGLGCWGALSDPGPRGHSGCCRLLGWGLQRAGRPGTSSGRGCRSHQACGGIGSEPSLDLLACTYANCPNESLGLSFSSSLLSQ